MATFRSMQYKEYVGNAGPGVSPITTFGVGNTRCVREFDVPWDDQDQAVLDILGYSEVKSTGGDARFLSRQIPMPLLRYFKRDMTSPFLYACAINEIKGMGVPSDKNMKDINDIARFTLARLTTEFRVLDYDILTDAEMVSAGYTDPSGNPDESTLKRFTSRYTRSKANYITLPEGTMKFATGRPSKIGTDVPAQPGRPLPGSEFCVVWHMVPEKAVPSGLLNPDMPFPTVPPMVNPRAGGAGGLLVTGSYMVSYSYVSARGTSATSPPSNPFYVTLGDKPSVNFAAFPPWVTSIMVYVTLVNTKSFKNYVAPGLPAGAITLDNAVATGNPDAPGEGVTLENMVGRVNKFQFAGQGAGQLLYTGYDPGRPYRDAFGERTYDITLLMEHAPYFHNCVPGELDVGSLGFVELSADGVSYSDRASSAIGKHIFDAADFAYLLRAP